MPRNRIVATKRGKAAIAAAMLVCATAGWGVFRESASAPPPAVVLATDALIKGWEGVVLKSHWDPYAKIWDICYGKTRHNGKPIQPGMSFTKAECDTFLKEDVYTGYYLPLKKGIKGFTGYPASVQATMVSGAYNFGVGAMLKSTAARLAAQGKWREACEAQTAFNRAGGRVVEGLVRRREMGDAHRIGEAELCVSGL